MKKIFKTRIFAFILGAVIFSGITGVVATGILASDVTYKNTTVDSALDDLYTKAKPEYTGSTTFTPSTTSQTIQTNNKVLKSDITINAIPSTYKNLTTTTDVDASKLLSGVKAYNNLGQLITGNSRDCVGGIFTCGTGCTNSTGQELFSFQPTRFYMFLGDLTQSAFYISEYSNKIYSTIKDTPQWDDITAAFSFKDGKVYAVNWGDYRLNATAYYIACK